MLTNVLRRAAGRQVPPLLAHMPLDQLLRRLQCVDLSNPSRSLSATFAANSDATIIPVIQDQLEEALKGLMPQAKQKRVATPSQNTPVENLLTASLIAVTIVRLNFGSDCALRNSALAAFLFYSNEITSSRRYSPVLALSNMFFLSQRATSVEDVEQVASSAMECWCRVLECLSSPLRCSKDVSTCSGGDAVMRSQNQRCSIDTLGGVVGGLGEFVRFWNGVAESDNDRAQVSLSFAFTQVLFLLWALTILSAHEPTTTTTDIPLLQEQCLRMLKEALAVVSSYHRISSNSRSFFPLRDDDVVRLAEACRDYHNVRRGSTTTTTGAPVISPIPVKQHDSPAAGVHHAVYDALIKPYLSQRMEDSTRSGSLGTLIRLFCQCCPFGATHDVNTIADVLSRRLGCDGVLDELFAEAGGCHGDVVRLLVELLGAVSRIDGHTYLVRTLVQLLASQACCLIEEDLSLVSDAVPHSLIGMTFAAVERKSQSVSGASDARVLYKSLIGALDVVCQLPSQRVCIIVRIHSVFNDAATSTSHRLVEEAHHLLSVGTIPDCLSVPAAWLWLVPCIAKHGPSWMQQNEYIAQCLSQSASSGGACVRNLVVSCTSVSSHPKARTWLKMLKQTAAVNRN